MTDDGINSLFYALLHRKTSDVERLRLYAMRDVLPQSMRESQAVMATLILQHDHEHRMLKIAYDIEERATKAAKAALKTTGEDCKKEFTASISVLAESVLRQAANRARAEALGSPGRDEFLVRGLCILVGMLCSFGLAFLISALGNR